MEDKHWRVIQSLHNDAGVDGQSRRRDGASNDRATLQPVEDDSEDRAWAAWHQNGLGWDRVRWGEWEIREVTQWTYLNESEQDTYVSQEG